MVKRAEMLEDAISELFIYTKNGVAGRSMAEALSRLKDADRIYREWIKDLGPMLFDEGYWYLDEDVYRQVLAQFYNGEHLRSIYRHLKWDWNESVNPTTNKDRITIDVMI